MPTTRSATIDFPRILTRAKRLLTNPQGGWEDIGRESILPRELIRRYLLVLAAVPAVALALQFFLSGRRTFLGALLTGVTCYAAIVGAVIGGAYLLVLLAGYFKAAVDHSTALKLTIFSLLPFFAASILLLFPPLKYFSALGLASFYYLYVGMGVLTGLRDDRLIQLYVSFIGAFLLFASLLDAAI